MDRIALGVSGDRPPSLLEHNPDDDMFKEELIEQLKLTY